MNYYNTYKSEILKPYSRNEEVAYGILKDVGIYEPKEININLICEHLGIELIYDNSFNSLFNHPLCKVITIDSRLSERNQRVIIAHEIGHIVLHKGNQFKLPEAYIRKQESQANNFAEHLLMPFYMFEQLPIDECVTENQLIHALSHEFRVPIDIAKRRLETLKSRINELVYGYGII